MPDTDSFVFLVQAHLAAHQGTPGVFPSFGEGCGPTAGVGFATTSTSYHGTGASSGTHETTDMPPADTGLVPNNLKWSIFWLVIVAYAVLASLVTAVYTAPPPEGTRIPHGRWSTSASTLASMGVALAGVYHTRHHLEAGEEPGKLPGAKAPAPVTFPVVWYRDSFRTHIGIILMSIAPWVCVRVGSPCLSWLAGDAMMAGCCIVLGSRIYLNQMEDQRRAESLAYVACVLSLVATSLLAVGHLYANLNEDGIALCPGNDDPAQVHNTPNRPPPPHSRL
jgi:hypothetical protein